jgi:hypothetical protein
MGNFPRYVWCRRGEDTYEAMLVNKEQGQYKGYRWHVTSGRRDWGDHEY